MPSYTVSGTKDEYLPKNSCHTTTKWFSKIEGFRLNFNNWICSVSKNCKNFKKLME